MMEVEAAVVEDVVETWECGAEEDQPGDPAHQERSEALDESTEVEERRRRRRVLMLEEELEEELVEELVKIVSHF